MVRFGIEFHRMHKVKGYAALVAFCSGLTSLAACGQTPSGNETAARTRTYTEQAAHTTDAASESSLRSQMIDLCAGEDPAKAPSAEECHRLADSFIALIHKSNANQASRPASGGCWGNMMVVLYPSDGSFPRLARMSPMKALNTAIVANMVGRQCDIYDSNGNRIPLI